MNKTDIVEPIPYELYIDFASLKRLWRIESDWPEGLVVSCAFQAAELCLQLLDGALDDHREVAFVSRRVDRLAEVLRDTFGTAAELLTGVTLPEEFVAAAAPARPSPGFEVLERLDRHKVQQVTDSFFAAFANIAFDVGLETQLNSIRERSGLPALLRSETPAPVMDYAAVVLPDAVRRLRNDEPFGAEDRLFAGIHQMTECWLHIAHFRLARTKEDAESGRWRDAAHHLEQASQAIQVVIKIGQLLDLMTLADYHPLRVRLRDGSGAQSRAARRIPVAGDAVLKPFIDELESKKLSMVQVLDSPADHLEFYRYLSALKTFGKRYQSFLFNHYLLVLGVLGTVTLGSLGYQIKEMADRAAQPLFPELDTAHHDYAVLTSFRDGAVAGAIILEKEVAAGWNPYTTTTKERGCPPEIVRARIADYFRYLDQRDPEGWVSLFDPDNGQFCDNTGSRPFWRPRRLRVFIDTIFASFATMRTTHAITHLDGNNADADWHFATTAYNGTPVDFGGTEAFAFTNDGLILSALAIWEPPDVAKQLRPTEVHRPFD
jgi:hypothetical protein